jgi:Oxidoreductase molybdopterin binding domain
MKGSSLDRLLAALLVAQLASGLLSLRAGSPPTAPLFLLHATLGGALLAAVVAKLLRSVPRAVAGRRWSALALGLLLGVAALAALAGGFVWVGSGRILRIGPFTVLTLHVLAALAIVPILVVHLTPRRWRRLPLPARVAGEPRISRRTALATLAVLGVGVAAAAGATAIEAIAGGARRFTGSRWLPDGSLPPPTTFFAETTRPIDSAAWRLRVTGRVTQQLTLSLEDLGQLGAGSSQAVLDCTSGWVLRTTWQGVPLAAVLDAAAPDATAGHVTIRSVTGWYARLPLPEARQALLATSVAGQPLPHGNGAPCRLVAPDRRGLEWVKWVSEIEIA